MLHRFLYQVIGKLKRNYALSGLDLGDRSLMTRDGLGFLPREMVLPQAKAAVSTIR